MNVPAVVWRSPWLRDLDLSARATLESAGNLRRLARDESVFGVGDAADAFFVVAEGLVEVRAVRRGEANASAIRRAGAGDAFGTEAVVRVSAARANEARCITAAVLVEVPAAVYRRLSGRGESGRLEGLTRAARESAAADTLMASGLARLAPPDRLRALAAQAEHREIARGEALFEAGDPATHVFVIADGMIELLVPDEERPRARAILSRGDVVLDPGVLGGASHAWIARASGPSWLLAFPREVMERSVRGGRAGLGEISRVRLVDPPPSETRHVMGDLWRFAVAGSMLVIDDDVCVRCGHCSWACADAHADGVSRLVRRGEKVTVRDPSDGSQRALVVPGSCQHCKHPACMLECPTGAIGRDAAGQVFVREELCIGCGQCVRACPWGTVQMAPRTPDERRRLPLASATVAVKCDACRELPGGAACVRACPVEAIARVDPSTAMAEVRIRASHRRVRSSLPRRRDAWPWVVGAGILAAAFSRLPASTRDARLASGAIAGLLLLALLGYAAIKRVGRRMAPGAPNARVHAIAHLATGVLTAGIAAWHAGSRLQANLAGGLWLSFVAASVTGGVAAAAYAVLPRLLARVERRAALHDDLPARARELDERAFGALTGRSDATKAAYARWLAPYTGAWLGGLRLILASRTLRDEERRLRAQIESAIGARIGHLDGIDDVIRLAVERRAVSAQRLLQAAMRAVVPVHVVCVAATAVLLVAHVVSEVLVR
jgi:Fe-S-cluster-containing dehydrogenase component/CRP-like cAMP-binding protein